MLQMKAHMAQVQFFSYRKPEIGTDFALASCLVLRDRWCVFVEDQLPQVFRILCQYAGSGAPVIPTSQILPAAMLVKIKVRSRVV
jgi:hypothetical protein